MTNAKTIAARVWAALRDALWPADAAPAALAPEHLTAPPPPEPAGEEALIRARRAEALLRDPLLAQAFATLERAYLAAWLATKSHDTRSRERLWDAVMVLRTVREHLAGVANGQTLLDETIRQITRRSATARREERTDA